jgi:hypothetical protein
VLTYKAGSWIAEAPASGGVTDHGNLTGLDDDDHKQYLAISGSRAMTGILKLGNNRITGLAAGTAATDAANLGQVLQSSALAGGDLSGTFANLSIAKLQGKTVSAAAPAAGDALVWNGANWAPAKVTAAAPQLNYLPLATITRRDNNFYQVWFNIDAPRNAAVVQKFDEQVELVNIVIQGEDSTAPNFLTDITGVIASTAERNVFHITLKKTEMPFMRFTFSLAKIMVKVEGVPLLMSLATYAKQNNIKFLGSEKDDFATIFVRVDL